MKRRGREKKTYRERQRDRERKDEGIEEYCLKCLTGILDNSLHSAGKRSNNKIDVNHNEI